jgi:glutamine synthetase
MDQREVLAAARRSGVKLVRFEYCDVSGVARAKAVHVSQLEQKMVEGVGLTRAQMSINMPSRWHGGHGVWGDPHVHRAAVSRERAAV